MPPAGGQTTARSRRAGRRATRRRKPERQSAQVVRAARAQQAAYGSQGRAVERVANRQRAAQNIRRAQAHSKPLAAKPMAHPRAGKPIRTRTRGNKVYAARTDVNQIVAAVNRQSRSVAADRERAVRAAARSRTNAVRAASRSGGELPGPRRSLAQQIVSALNIYGVGDNRSGARRGSRIAASRGISTASVRGVAQSVPGLAVREMGLAIAQKPSLATRVPGDLAKYAVGAPAGLVESAAHPRQAASSSLADIKRRYGALARGDPKAFRERIKKEGLTPELVDLVSTAVGTGAVAGRVVQRAAVRGALGAAARGVATARPALRISGNVARAQEVSPNFARNATRAAVDARRRRVQAKRAGREDAPLEVRLAQERGEVTYTSRRRQGREQRRLVAQEKGTEVQRLKMVQQREHAQALRNLNSLSKTERRGFALAHQFGATSPVAAKALIQRRLKDIAAHREQKAGENPSYAVSRRRDQAPELQWLHDNADKVFTPKLREVVRQEQARERRIAAKDPGVDLTQAQLRRYQPVAAALGIERAAGESNARFLRRVNTEARRQGLERPGYLHSEERPRGVFATMALGGSKATNIPKAYTGSLLRQGIESMDPDVHLQGVARGLKRRQQWNMVARNLERHAVDKLGGKSMRGRDIVGLTRDLENAGVDLQSVAFWNPRKFFEESQRKSRDTEGRKLEDAGGEDALAGSSDVHAALQRAVVSPAEVRGNPEAFANAQGFSVVPAAVLKEIEGAVRPEGLFSRSVDISRGKISRVLLGNPAWLTFQVASNAFLSGLAGVGPIDAVKAQRWWKGLSDAEKEALAPEVGIHGWYDEQTRLGATANNNLVNGYRAMKQTGLYQLAHKANPLDAIFRADNAQNNFFRKAVFYNQAKREAYRRMGDNATRMIRAQQGINRVLKLDPQERITAAAKDPKTFEHHARAVRDFLGDYTSYTSRERARLGRYAMFYGFLRHSLRLTFYTLPVKHPMMTAIGLELGKLHNDELRKLFGVEPPVWEQANAYVKVGGKTRKFAIGRLNPFFNAVQYEGPGSLVQLATPLASIAMDQLATKNVAFGRPWTVGGSGSYVIRNKDVSKEQRLKVALAQALHLSPYIRLAEKTGIPGLREPMVGRQTDESSLVFPDPTRYKAGGPAAARNATRIAEQRAVSPRENLLRTLLPVFGEPAAPIIRSSREYAAGQEGTDAPAPPARGVAADPDVQAARREISAARQNAGRGILDDPEIQRIRKELARRP